jgi:intraflagellar transport protein 140
MEQLSSFYSQMASAEIDEYRDYEKALGALQESLKFMIKAKASEKKESALADLDAKIRLVTKFVEARKLVKKNPAEMIKICTSLLDQPDIEVIIMHLPYARHS